MTLRELQLELEPWQLHNFGHRPSWHPLMGVVEEVGELAHSHLKSEQGIRTSEAHTSKAMDAIGDIVIYLADYCQAKGWDFDRIVEETWREVKKRDWKKYPENGLTS